MNSDLFLIIETKGDGNIFMFYIFKCVIYSLSIQLRANRTNLGQPLHLTLVELLMSDNFRDGHCIYYL